MNSKKITTAFILGAGLGTRLRPLTDDTPKPLLPVDGRPIITYALEHLQTIGIRRFIINTHHLANKYAQAFPDGNWRGIPIAFRHESVLLETAGGIKNIEDLIVGEENIVVYNGDIITNLPLMPLIAGHFEQKTEVTLALRSSGHLLNVNIDSNGFVCDLRHILQNPGIRSCLFTGIYIVQKRFLQRLTAGRPLSIVPVLAEMIRNNYQSVGGIVLDDGIWHDPGTLEEYKKLNNKGLGLVSYSCP